jgi:hypothetical protein
MVDDSPEDTSLAADPGRAKRPPPTIDLEASEVTTSTASPAEDAPPDVSPPEPSPPKPARSSIATAVIAGISGAAVAALVFAGAILAGWPEAPPAPPASAPANSAATDDLAARLASLETRLGKSPAPAPDPALAARVEALDKSVAALRGELDGLSGRSEKLAAEVNDIKTVPQETAPQAPPPDLSAINDRIAGLERAIRAQKAEITQENAKPADDVPLRRIVAAGLLDVLVRVGDPFAAALTAAKSLTPNPDELKPLETFAATGVPSPANLCRELLTLVPKLSPAAPVVATTGSGIVERLEAGAAKLVRIERTDTKGNDRENVVARVTAAALRNDVNEARRELNTLPSADRAAAQGWIEKADARDAALASSRQFAATAMSALAGPAP